MTTMPALNFNELLAGANPIANGHRPVTGQTQAPQQAPSPTGLQPINTPQPGHLEELLGISLGAAYGLTAEDERSSDSPPRWEVSELNARHREIMRRIIEGATYIEIAEAMGIHKQTVMLVCTSPMFREELGKLESQLDVSVIKRADDLSNEALDTLKMMMRRGKSEALKVRAAREILDTAGYSKVEKKLIGVVRGEDVIRELNKRRVAAIEALDIKPERVINVDTGIRT